MLAPAEEKKIARKVRKGNQEARDRMIQANLRLVVSIAKCYVNRGLPFLDLVEEGNLGLLKAIEHYDPEKGFRFSTYATWWIKQSIQRALVNTARTVRIPSYMVEMIARWKNCTAELSQELGRKPYTNEVMRRMDLPPESFEILKRAINTSSSATRPISLEVMWIGRAEGERIPFVSPKEDVLDASDVERIEQLLAEIDDREAEVLRQRYGLAPEREPKTLSEVGRSLKITRERVRQIEKRAIMKIRKALNEQQERLKRSGSK